MKISRRKVAPGNSVVRVGIISDTHALLRPEVKAVFQNVDHIIHAGDIGDPAILEQLRDLAPLTAVAGNIEDFQCGSASEEARVEIGGLRFYVTHIVDRPSRLRNEVRLALEKSPADVVIFGHSHLPHDEVIGGVRYFNPASAGPRRFDYPVSVGLMELRNGSVRSKHVPLDRRSAGALETYMNRLTQIDR